MEKKSPKVKIKEVIPRYYAQACPVCNSWGSLRYGTKVCQACEGKGYILVPTGIDGRKDGQRKS